MLSTMMTIALERTVHSVSVYELNELDIDLCSPAYTNLQMFA